MDIERLRKLWIDSEMCEMPQALQNIIDNLEILKTAAKSKEDAEQIAWCIDNIRNMMCYTDDISKHVDGFFYWNSGNTPNQEDLLNLKKLLAGLSFVVTKFPVSVAALLERVDVKDEFLEPETLHQKLIISSCRLIDTLHCFYHLIISVICVENDGSAEACDSKPGIGFFHREKERLKSRAQNRGKGLEDLNTLLENVQSAKGELDKLCIEAEVDLNLSGKRTLK
jgi:hypothetical protein